MTINGISVIEPAPAGFSVSAMPPFGVSEIRQRIQAVQEVMRGVMKEGTCLLQVVVSRTSTPGHFPGASESRLPPPDRAESSNGR
jgi:hypothetical protein